MFAGRSGSATPEPVASNQPLLALSGVRPAAVTFIEEIPAPVVNAETATTMARTARRLLGL